jgi:hypothetical protein
MGLAMRAETRHGLGLLMVAPWVHEGRIGINVALGEAADEVASSRSAAENTEPLSSTGF